MEHATREELVAQAIVSSALAWAQAQGIQPQPGLLAILQQYTQGEMSWLEVQAAFSVRNMLYLNKLKGRAARVLTSEDR